MITKLNCEDIGFVHCWKDTTPSLMYATDPPIFSPCQRRCVNCGREEVEVVVHPKVVEWHLIGES